MTTPKPKDSALKRFLLRSRTATVSLRRLRTLSRGLKPIAHEPEFLALRNLTLSSDLAIDVGANNGQSITSIIAVRPEMNVVAIEPNPECYPELNLISKLRRGRVKIIQAGAGDHAGKLTFFVPRRNRRMLLEEGTFDRTSLATSGSVKRNGVEGVDFEVVTMEIPVITIDSLNLVPGVIKIDVQGFEMQALRGMAETIRRHRPVILLELGHEHEQFAQFLEPFGYVERYWGAGTLIPTNLADRFNVLFVTPDHLT
ncbi:FkbM family methyltransferase [Brevundimonas sp. TWP2-3-2]|uniref:FkbM family methyltransferase n=1 Tax=unclassified Brevundimonas TaxID=2622653 RepID=UPI003CEB2176